MASLNLHPRITPVRWELQVIEITRNADGSMLCKQRSGNEFTIPADMFEVQEFVVYTMLNSDTRESESEYKARTKEPM